MSAAAEVEVFMASLIRPPIPSQDAEFGDPRLIERFWAKVERSGACWEWVAVQSRGYGRFYLNGSYQSAHRVSYTALVGPIPAATPQLDHLCRNTLCVRPSHLEPVTNQENSVRSASPWLMRNKETCRNGLHPWPASAAPEYPGEPPRCSRCRRAKHSRRSERLRAERKSP